MAISLRTVAISGARWFSGSAAIVASVGFVQNIVLSRLLSPHDFGLSGMVWVFLGFAQMFSDAGMSLGTVQRRQVTAQQQTTIHWTNVGVAFVIALLCYLGRPFWASYFREPVLAQLVPWAALTLVTTAFAQQFQASAQREFRFYEIAISDALGAVFGFIIAIITAILGAGVYALVLGGLASSLMRTAAITVGVWGLWHPSWHWRWADLNGFLRFGGFQLGDRIANYVWNNADYMLIGRLLGADALGYYRLAFETVIRPLGTLNPILNRVSYPIFAAKQADNTALQTGFLEMVRLIASAVAPMMVGLSVIAPWFVVGLFGPAWSPAILLIQILSPLGLLRSLLNATAQINIAKGHVDYVFYLNSTLAVVLPLGFWGFAKYGLVVLSIAELAILGIVMVLAWIPLHRLTFGLDAKDYLLAIGKPILLSLAMGACVYLVSMLLPRSWNASFTVLLLVLVGVACQLVLLAKFDVIYIKRITQLIKQNS